MPTHKGLRERRASSVQVNARYNMMKITFVGNAGILVEAGGVLVLSDPWWRGPCFGAQWWGYPLPYVEALESRKID